MSLKKQNIYKIAVFGSAFNPPSLGHKSIIDSLAHFDLVLLVPSISHAWGKKMLDFDVRCHLVELFIKDIDSDNVKLCKIEKELFNNGDSVTTFALLSALEHRHPNSELSFIMGPDNMFNFDKFEKHEQIVTRWPLIICPEKHQIRSTMIRHNLIKSESISHLTTRSVEEYLIMHRLY